MYDDQEAYFAGLVRFLRALDVTAPVPRVP
jgi:hypothetical protein